MHILIVDDRDENRYLLEVLLKANGHEVLSSTNGAEALECLKAGRVELIISDILMPVMDGFELCRQVKTDQGLRGIPFIIYTATYTGPQDEAFAMKIGADRFIQKPCEPDVFMDAVGEVLAAVRHNDIDVAAVPPQEEEILKLYNERLVRKLEQKTLLLEREVQARQKVEETLRQSEEKYRLLYNSIRDAILVSDTTRSIVDCNRTFVDLFGYSLEEIAGQKTFMFYENEEDFKRQGDAQKDHFGKARFAYTVNFKKKNGVVFPGEVNVFSILNDNDKLIGFIGIIRDITERKRAEQIQKELEFQLYQAQKLESVGRLAGGVAHDFNNLLSIILGYGGIVLEALGKNHPQHEPLEQVYQAGVRARNLTRQLLAFSRKQVLEMEVQDVKTVVAGFEKLLRRLIGEDVQLVLVLATEPLAVKADATQLEQVLMNLAINARDAMPLGGTLTIETDFVELDQTYAENKPGVLPGAYAMIGISDTGCGMDKETLEHIFEPFFTTKEKDKGTGLGLATSYGIVKQHGGNIWVYSEPGQGTTFKIYLPRCAADYRAAAPLVQCLPPVIGETTVLVVEDDPAVRKLVCQILRGQGYTVIDTNDVADATAKAAAHVGRLHLVLTDVVMPKMKGPEVFSQIHQHHPEARVLYMSGYTDNLVASHGVLKEGLQFIQKPFTIKALLEKCHYVLHNA